MKDGNNKPGYRNGHWIGDIPIMADAFMTACATALMFGEEGQGSRDRMRELKEEMLAISPIPQPTGGRRESYHWRDICAKIGTAGSYGIRIVRADPKAWTDDGKRHVLVVLDGIVRRVAADLETERARIVAGNVQDALAEIAGMDTVFRSRLDIVVTFPDAIYDDKERAAAVKAIVAGVLDPEVASEIEVMGFGTSKRGDDGSYRLAVKVEAPKHLHEYILLQMETAAAANDEGGPKPGR